MMNAVSRAYVRGGAQALTSGLKASAVAVNSMGKILRESFPRILLPPFSGRFFGFKVLAKIGLPTFMRITNFHAPAIFYAVFYGHFMRWMRSAEEKNHNLCSLIN